MRAARFILLGLTLSVGFCAPVAFAANAMVGLVSPRGGQRGTDVDFTFQGTNLTDAEEVLFYEPGLTVKELKVENPTTVKVKMSLAADARLGEHRLRLRTKSGVSWIRTIWVGAFPIVEEVEPNSDFQTPQKIGMNVTVTGVVKNEDVDYYQVEVKKGDRISAEIEGMRLGGDVLDTYLAILDSNRFELAASDDTALLLQDPVVSCIAPADGNYIIQMREASYGGADSNIYRLHVGNFPRPRTIYPSGGKVGEDVNVTMLGDVSGPITQSIKLPDKPVDKFGIFAEQNGQTSPSPCYFRVSNFGNQLEVEPNNDQSTATRYDGELPIAFNGVISSDGDVDWFRFKAVKGAAYDLNVYARRLRSPLDSVFTINNKDGGQLGANDDSGGPDSYLQWTAPEDGEYTVRINDQLMRGSADSVYRIEITPQVRRISVNIPSPDPNAATQERQAIVIPRGNRFATTIRLARQNVGGDVALTAPVLPPGVTMTCEPYVGGADVIPVVFEAAADAPVGGQLVDMSAVSQVETDKGLSGGVHQTISFVPNGNQPPFYVIEVEKLAVVVAEEAQYAIRLEQPKVPLVQGGAMNLKVVLERKKDFDAPVKVRMLFNPPGTGSGEVEIPKGKDEVLLPINANLDAPIRKTKVCVLTSCDLPGGLQWISSQMIELDVAASLLGGKIDLAATEQGKPAQVVVHLENKTKYDGEATLKLLGLPNSATAPDLKIKATDTEVVFNVATDVKATPVGQHNALQCQVILPQNGEEIVQGFAAGGVLRVDAPPPPKADEPKPAEVAMKPPEPAAAPAPDAKPEKVLTRLEKLRLEQQQKAAAK